MVCFKTIHKLYISQEETIHIKTETLKNMLNNILSSETENQKNKKNKNFEQD